MGDKDSMELITAQLHYHLSDDDKHDMPSDVLCKLMDAINVLAYLTASGLGASEDIKFANYADFQKDYMVSCSSPEPGSFILPFEIIKNSNAAKIAPSGIVKALFASLLALNTGTLAGTPLERLDPDDRVRFANQLQRMIPEVGSGCRLLFEMKGETGTEIEISSDFVDRATLCLNPVDVQQENEVRSVVGLVSQVDFDRRELTLKIPYCNKEIKCLYGQGTPLSLLFDGRKSRLQVIGEFEYDDEGDPITCKKVTSIAPIDLSQMVVPMLGKQLVFTPTLDVDTEQLYVIEDPRYGIDVYSDNRRELLELIQEQLLANMRHYSREDDARLCPEVLDVKRKLIDLFGTNFAAEGMGA